MKHPVHAIGKHNVRLLEQPDICYPGHLLSVIAIVRIANFRIVNVRIANVRIANVWQPLHVGHAIMQKLLLLLRSLMNQEFSTFQNLLRHKDNLVKDKRVN